MLPSEYVNLSDEEKAFIIAAIQIKAEQEDKERKKLERTTKRIRRK